MGKVYTHPRFVNNDEASPQESIPEEPITLNLVADNIPHLVGTLPHHAVCVFLVVASEAVHHRSERTDDYYPCHLSIHEIAEICALTVRSAHSAISALIDIEAIDVIDTGYVVKRWQG